MGRCLDQRMSPTALIACLLTMLSATGIMLAGEASEGVTLAIGGSFAQSDIRRFLPGSRATILYPARPGPEGRFLPLGASNLTPGQWESSLASWKERASLLLTTIDPEMIRDEQGVIQAGILRGADPLLTTSVLLPGFLQRFSAIFGPEILVAIPSETTVYVFPKLANRLPEFRERIVDEFLLSPRPVTTEFFELSRKGMRAVGDFRTEE